MWHFIREGGKKEWCLRTFYIAQCYNHDAEKLKNKWARKWKDQWRETKREWLMQGLFIQGMENQTKETEINSSEINY
jgi:site-specific recombinase